MKLKKFLVYNIILAILAASLIFFFQQKGFLTRLELASLDFSFRLRGPLSYNPHIIIIEVSDYDITKIGRWPWKRTWHAAMTRALTDLGAKYIYFDIVFSEGAGEEDDKLLEESIKESKRVYLPSVFQEPSFDSKSLLCPIERFASYIKGTGAINIYPDSDGVIRRIPLVFPTEKGAYLHMALKLALDYSGLKIEDLKMPLDKNNTLLINWLGKWQDTFRHYSFLEVLAEYKKFKENKLPAKTLSNFKDSICLVAVTAIGLYDIKPVPLQPAYPSIGILATTINNIINKHFIYTPPMWVNILILYILTLVPAFLIFGERPLRETGLIVLIGAIYFMINFFFFKMGTALNLTTPLAGLILGSLSVGTYNFVRVSVERKTFFKMSVTDGLTGLYNIRYFKLLLETEIMLAKPDPNKKFSILMSDVDHFKHFNDTYGHQVGDLVLKEVANVLKTIVRSSDIVARYGGEEMIILLRGTPLKDALIIAEKIRKGIENTAVKDEKNTYNVTISLGVSIYKPADTVDSIIKRADDGLYKSKEAGRNRVSTIEEAD